MVVVVGFLVLWVVHFVLSLVGFFSLLWFLLFLGLLFL